MSSDGLILFGGSFDPVHCGHIQMAQFAMSYLNVNRLIMIPAARSPHKITLPTATGQDRLEMIRLAIRGIAGLEVSDIELKRAQPSYTYDTIVAFREQTGFDAALYWLVGADSIADLPYWYRIVELLDKCQLCIMYRAGYERPSLKTLQHKFRPDQIDALERHIIPTPLVDISSTVVRKRIAAGLAGNDIVCPDVLEYIIKNRLYH
ncbi:MAG: nicotinate (nicotinamide) nucleotide adenylyltransferase [Sedimentisphaerales bacterium]|nr:nicotinate (nicotinamide) nucleotide adenylyltransferase [Sedimentisphaerales bacterium]